MPRVRDGVHLGAVRDGDRRRILNVHQASDGDEMPPNGPVPSGLHQDGLLTQLRDFAYATGATLDARLDADARVRDCEIGSRP